MTRRIVLIDIGNSLDLSGVLPSVHLHDTYSARISARNGVAPYTYATDSVLPDGVELDPATGIFSSGDVGTAGTFTIAVTATDLAGTAVTRDFVLSVVAEPVLLTLTGSYASATAGTPYSSDLTIAGGGGTYSNPRVTVGTLPDGLALSVVSDKLRLSGTPTTVATIDFTVAVDSADGQTATSAQSVTVVAAVAATWDPLNKDVRMALSMGDLMCTCTSHGTYFNAMGNLGQEASTANHYFQLVVGGVDGNPQTLGLTSAATYNNITAPAYAWANVWGYEPPSGKYAHAGEFIYGPALAAGAKLGILLKAGKLYFRVNGVWVGGANPDAGTGAVASGLAGTLKPFAQMSKEVHSALAQFSVADIGADLPSGSSAWAS